MDWSAVDYCDVLSDSHSDGTHSLQSIHYWDTEAMLNFSKSVPMKSKQSVLINVYFCVWECVSEYLYECMWECALYKYIILWVWDELKGVINYRVLNLLSGGALWLTLPDTVPHGGKCQVRDVFYHISFPFISPRQRCMSHEDQWAFSTP